METKRSYTAPQGTVIKEVKLSDDKKTLITIFEEEKHKFKKGDFIYGTGLYKGAVAIFSEYTCNNTSFKEIAGVFMSGKLHTNSDVNFGNPFHFELCTSNQEEYRKKLIDALARQGKQWNAEKLCIDPLKYVPKVGDCVKLSNEEGKCIYMVYGGLSRFQSHINKGSYINSQNKVRHDHDLGFNNDLNIFEFIKESDFQQKFNELGYEYNFETHTADKMRWKPELGDSYFCSAITIKQLYFSSRWTSDVDDFHKMESNLIFKTKEEAIERSKQLLNIK